MTRILSRIAEVSEQYEALIVDLWGCYHDGIRPYADAVEALRAYRRDGGVVVLLTNAPRPAAHVQQFLDQIGAPRDSHDAIMSSGQACQRAMASGDHGRAFHYLGPDRDLHMLSDIGLEPVAVEEADALLCTGLADDKADPRIAYADAIRAWRERGLPMLCANPDIVVDRGDERLWCAGALARAYEEAGGQVVWFGKPHAPTYEQTFALIAEIAGREIARERMLAIGDGIHTDIAGALLQGLDAVFITGGLAAEEMGPDPENPEPARLERFLGEEGLEPAYAMGRLR
ncbi:MAG TPA: TIGR01459 family HAD-type hydrolase [Thermohalobaculum sp.]|nr:TIGR01459 family HAD-type hydrolase [Thermohalobaculum sp.]